MTANSAQMVFAFWIPGNYRLRARRMSISQLQQAAFYVSGRLWQASAPVADEMQTATE